MVEKNLALAGALPQQFQCDFVVLDGCFVSAFQKCQPAAQGPVIVGIVFAEILSSPRRIPTEQRVLGQMVARDFGAAVLGDQSLCQRQRLGGGFEIAQARRENGG